ncbi:MAG: hypothetical protein QOH97_2586 [Actinoplanes sp.]|jgi:hypothetical protein|nr:hypothetical protein [Actinoplanes sp.]
MRPQPATLVAALREAAPAGPGRSAAQASWPWSGRCAAKGWGPGHLMLAAVTTDELDRMSTGGRTTVAPIRPARANRCS